MEAINALIYVMGIYVLTLVVALFVVVAIVAIRWATGERVKTAPATGKQGVKTGEVRT